MDGPAKRVTITKGTISTTDGTTIEIDDVETIEQYATLERTDENVKVEKINGYDIFGTIKIKLAEGISINQLYIYVPSFKQGDSIICKALINNSWTTLESELIADEEFQINNLAQTANIEFLKGE